MRRIETRPAGRIRRMATLPDCARQGTSGVTHDFTHDRLTGRETARRVSAGPSRDCPSWDRTRTLLIQSKAQRCKSLPRRRPSPTLPVSPRQRTHDFTHDSAHGPTVDVGGRR